MGVFPKFLGFPKPKMVFNFQPRQVWWIGGGKTMFVDLSDLSAGQQNFWLRNGNAEVAKSNNTPVTLGIG